MRRTAASSPDSLVALYPPAITGLRQVPLSSSATPAQGGLALQLRPGDRRRHIPLHRACISAWVATVPKGMFLRVNVAGRSAHPAMLRQPWEWNRREGRDTGICSGYEPRIADNHWRIAGARIGDSLRQARRKPPWPLAMRCYA